MPPLINSALMNMVISLTPTSAVFAMRSYTLQCCLCLIARVDVPVGRIIDQQFVLLFAWLVSVIFQYRSLHVSMPMFTLGIFAVINIGLTLTHNFVSSLSVLLGHYLSN